MADPFRGCTGKGTEKEERKDLLLAISGAQGSTVEAITKEPVRYAAQATGPEPRIVWRAVFCNYHLHCHPASRKKGSTELALSLNPGGQNSWKSVSTYTPQIMIAHWRRDQKDIPLLFPS